MVSKKENGKKTSFEQHFLDKSLLIGLT